MTALMWTGSSLRPTQFPFVPVTTSRSGSSCDWPGGVLLQWSQRSEGLTVLQVEVVVQLRFTDCGRAAVERRDHRGLLVTWKTNSGNSHPHDRELIQMERIQNKCIWRFKPDGQNKFKSSKWMITTINQKKTQMQPKTYCLLSEIICKCKSEALISEFLQSHGRRPYPGPKRMIHCRPRRRSRPGHVTGPPLGEWTALTKGPTNRRCRNPEEAGALEGWGGLLLSGWSQETPPPAGWMEQRRRRRRILQVKVQTLQSWTWGRGRGAAVRLTRSRNGLCLKPAEQTNVRIASSFIWEKLKTSKICPWELNP